MINLKFRLYRNIRTKLRDHPNDMLFLFVERDNMENNKLSHSALAVQHL